MYFVNFLSIDYGLCDLHFKEAYFLMYLVVLEFENSYFISWLLKCFMRWAYVTP